MTVRHRSDAPGAGGSPPGNGGDDNAAAPEWKKPYGQPDWKRSYGSSTENEIDWDALRAAKEERIEKAAELWSEGKLCSEIADSLG